MTYASIEVSDGVVTFKRSTLNGALSCGPVTDRTFEKPNFPKEELSEILEQVAGEHYRSILCIKDNLYLVGGPLVSMGDRNEIYESINYVVAQLYNGLGRYCELIDMAMRLGTPCITDAIKLIGQSSRSTELESDGNY